MLPLVQGAKSTNVAPDSERILAIKLRRKKYITYAYLILIPVLELLQTTLNKDHYILQVQYLPNFKINNITAAMIRIFEEAVMVLEDASLALYKTLLGLEE